ncbi:cupredoxin domain-containing protein [Candidatus Peribacteria bacterium]|nr:cupredoxin domain-containing protein [Candidatus Peribacteria bacterium]
MDNLHPHWQEEEEGQPVPVRAKETQTVSRQPAAIFGVLLVVGLGLFFFRGAHTLQGQATPTGPTITISDEGMLPNRLEVEHGQTITFINNQDILQSIQSNTLCSDTGYCLETKQLMRGDSDTFTITPDMRSGPYEFASSVSGDIRGVIIIVTDTVDDFVDLASTLDANIFDEEVASPQAVEQVGIPRNPYTVDSERIHPFDNTGTPIDAAFGDAPGTYQAQATFAQSQGPLRQPETGAGGISALVVLSILILWRLNYNQGVPNTQ